MSNLLDATGAVGAIVAYQLAGSLSRVDGFTADAAGLSGLVAVGDLLAVIDRDGQPFVGEVVGCSGEQAHVLIEQSNLCLAVGGAVHVNPAQRGTLITPSPEWIGRVLDAFGSPTDGKPTPANGVLRHVRTEPPPAADRCRLGGVVTLGIRALDVFTTCRASQRLGLFAAAGVGKSTLLAMLAQFAVCDVIVISLIGERGREVREFVEDALGPQGLARSVVVAATSDMSPLARRQALYTAMTVAEYFRDAGQDVLLLVDSVTRFCHALREIAIAAGQAPVARGYPPSVFSELPKVLERAGPGRQRPDGPSGQMTAIFAVLVDGDDHDEPVADAVRGTLDGHVVLDRDIAEAGRFPAVNVKRSVSRSVPGCLDDSRAKLANEARRILARYDDVVDLVRMGAYQAGSDPSCDRAIAVAPQLQAWLCQGRDQNTTVSDAFEELAALLAG